MATLVLDGSGFDFDAAWRILCGETTRLRLSPAAWARVERARKVVDRIVAEGRTVYGVSTGFGKFQDVAIPREKLERLQLNLLRSHAAGVGAPLPAWEVRLCIALRANTLARGHSGVSPRVLRALLALFERNVLPVVPSQGSVGASGDLAPLAHLALVLVGEGEATIDGKRMPGGEALAKAGLKPVRLGPKDALSLINGTQVTNALGLTALVFADALARAADVAAAMSLEALRGSFRPFLPRVQEVRPHPGQAVVARNVMRLVRGSKVFASHRSPHGKVQDPYSLRCVPQVHGAARDVLGYALGVSLREANSTTDNPLVFPGEREEIVSAGNFHAEPLALAFDAAAMAAAELASISERRIETLVNPDLSGGLPPFLAEDGGLESGSMIVQVTAAALVSENKVLCHPASVDSIPTSGNQEDHVSMGTTAARKFGQVVANAEHVVAAELLCAAEALDLRGGPAPGKGVAAAHRCVRKWAPRVRGDHPPAPGIHALARAIRAGAIGESVTGIEGSEQVKGLHCRNWQIEAPYRMLLNNLHPDVAEDPKRLIVYGGSGKAARNRRCLDAILGSLRALREDETLLVQSGKPVAVFRTHRHSPRVLIANSNLVGRWANWEHFRELEARGLMMYGQMTAGSWIYIGTQGILQGTYETFAAAGRKHFRRDTLRGRLVVSAGLGGMGGAQPLAATMNEGTFLGADVDPKRIAKRLKTRYLDEVAPTVDAAIDRALAAKAAGEAVSIAVACHATTLLRRLLDRRVTPDLLTDQTSAHDPLGGYVPDSRTLKEALALRKSDPRRYERESRRTIVDHCRMMVSLAKRGAATFDYGNNLRGFAKEEGFAGAFSYPGFVPAYIRPLFCEGKGPFRWAVLSGDPEDLRKTDEAILRLFPKDRALARWIRLAQERVAFQGLPARICWLGYGERARAGLAFNRMVRSGALSAPVVIGRDHLDSGSVASPNRETEAMRDGSDAVADWPILNALLNAAAGATWVSFHHGGGVGMGYSLHAGMVICCDGTREMDARIERVLTCDPGTGVARHADAGYPEARRTARERGVRIPMAGTGRAG